MTDRENGPLPVRWDCLNEPLGPLENLLAGDYSLEIVSEPRTKLELFDSFELGLTTAGLALVKSKGEFRLVDAADLRGRVRIGAKLPRRKRVFWWDFAPGEVCDQLRRHLGLRAAVHLTTVDLSWHRVQIRNRDGKIVVRLWREQGQVEGRPLRAALTLAPLLGYTADAEQVAERIERASETFAPAREPLAERVLRLADRLTLPLSHKRLVQITADETVFRAVIRISEFLLLVARQNEAGIAGDVDTEFLHDYRVALRQLRSLLHLVKGAYTAPETERIRELLGAFGRATNRLRDLDVYLLEKDAHRARLPVALRPGLDPMFGAFERERTRELGRLKRRLLSDDYRKQITELQQRLHEQDFERGERAELPIGEVALHEIERRSRKLTKLGRKLSADSPDRAVHALRIECKKLRYLLEIFAQLFDRARLRPLVKRLKSLQDVLGAFNDNAVQQAALLRYLESATTIERETAAAVGALIGVLHGSEVEARGALRTRFARFDHASTRRWIRELADRPALDA